MQQEPDIENTDSENEISCLERILYNSGRKVYKQNWQTDTDEKNFVEYRYRNNMYLKNSEKKLNLTEFK